MADGLELSIVLESTTEILTGKRNVADTLKHLILEAEKSTDQFEILALVADDRPQPSSDPRVRLISLPKGTIYYKLKNIGANEARGKIIFFTDADVRVCEGFFRILIREYAKGDVCLAGRSFYDGPGLITRLSTAASFGYLHADQNPHTFIPISHNLSILREEAGKDPFGPYVGRNGGEPFLLLNLRNRGKTIRLVHDLVTYHEDLSFSLRATIDRHYGEAFNRILYRRVNPKKKFRLVLRSILNGPMTRIRRIWKWKDAVGLKAWQVPLGALIQFAYLPAEVVVFLIGAITPSLRDRWFRYEYGLPEAEFDAFISGPLHVIPELRKNRQLSNQI